jgi:hypothetical protein
VSIVSTPHAGRLEGLITCLRFLRLFAAGDFLSNRWRDLILGVWHVDPLRCPVCENPMRVIAVTDDPRVVETILRHLGAWQDPPAPLPPPDAPGPYTCEPCSDVARTPDYENALTD